MLTEVTERCTKCGEWKPLDAFSKDSRRKNHHGCQCHCKACAASEKAEWRDKYPERNAASARRYHQRNPERHLRSKFGVDPSIKSRLLAEQGSRCAGCGANEHGNPKNKGPRGWCLDHDHTTNQIRGVLCWTCNLTLGYAKDSPERLAGLIRYLERAVKVRAA